MYTYKRFKTSKSSVVIILIALALAAWGILGFTGTPLAKKGGGDGKETATFELTYSNDSALTFSEGTVTATADIGPGKKMINVFPSRPEKSPEVLNMPFLPDCVTPSGNVGITNTAMLINQDRSASNTVVIGFWFNALPVRDDGSNMGYFLEMRGTFREGDDLFPAKNNSTVITASSGDHWELEVDRKDRSRACAWEGDGESWTLTIRRVS